MSEKLYFTSPPQRIKLLSPRIVEMASAAPTRVVSIGQRKNPGYEVVSTRACVDVTCGNNLESKKKAMKMTFSYDKIHYIFFLAESKDCDDKYTNKIYTIHSF